MIRYGTVIPGPVALLATLEAGLPSTGTLSGDGGGNDSDSGGD